GERREDGDRVRDVTGSLALPPSEKHGSDWWEITLRFIVHEAGVKAARSVLSDACWTCLKMSGARQKSYS
ncbi:unnamed protein product, partial [Ascophyllum nodosum]